MNIYATLRLFLTLASTLLLVILLGFLWFWKTAGLMHTYLSPRRRIGAPVVGRQYTSEKPACRAPQEEYEEIWAAIVTGLGWWYFYGYEEHMKLFLAKFARKLLEGTMLAVVGYCCVREKARCCSQTCCAWDATTKKVTIWRSACSTFF